MPLSISLKVYDSCFLAIPFFLFFLLLHPTIFFSLKQTLYLVTSLSHSPTSLSLFISNILSVYFCLSNYLCMALSVIHLFFCYLSIHSLSLHNCNSLLVFNFAPLPISSSLQYYLAILIFDYFLLITLSLSLSFTHRLSVFSFHYFCLTLSLYYSLFR